MPKKQPKLIWIKEVRGEYCYVLKLLNEKETVMKTKLWAPLLSIAILGLSGPLMADSDSKEVQALTKQVRSLSDEVARLRKAVESLQAVQPTMTTLMPDFAERFHVMHLAGDAGDWAVAAHELLELERLVGVAKHIDQKSGALMEGFMNQSFRSLNAAIEHGDHNSFTRALGETVKNCNACHNAVGSPFIEVSLEVDESLNMRHPHALHKSKKPGEHMHKH